MTQIEYFIELILHWSPGDQKIPMSFLLSSSSNQRELFTVNNSAFGILIDHK